MLKNILGYIKSFLSHGLVTKVLLLALLIHLIKFGFTYLSNLSTARLEYEEAIARFEICQGKLHTWDACKKEYHIKNQWPFVRATEMTLRNLPSCYIDDCSSILNTILNNLLVQIASILVTLLTTWGILTKISNMAKNRRYNADRWSPIDHLQSQQRVISYDK